MQKLMDEICDGCKYVKRCTCLQKHVIGCNRTDMVVEVDREAGTCTGKEVGDTCNQSS